MFELLHALGLMADVTRRSVPALMDPVLEDEFGVQFGYCYWQSGRFLLKRNLQDVIEDVWSPVCPQCGGRTDVEDDDLWICSRCIHIFEHRAVPVLGGANG